MERLLELAPRGRVVTERIERDVRVRGRGTTNQIDVLWVIADAAGARYRVVFEAPAQACADGAAPRQPASQPALITRSLRMSGQKTGSARVASASGRVALVLRPGAGVWWRTSAWSRAMSDVLDKVDLELVDRPNGRRFLIELDDPASGSCSRTAWMSSGSARQMD